jgi:hypothetical protein
MAKEQRRIHQIDRVVHQYVYQPAKVIRAVSISLEAGEFFTSEFSVLGCVTSVMNRYVIQLHDGRSPPIPTGPGDKDLTAAGYQFRSQDIEHDVLVWSEEYNCPLPLNDPLTKCSNEEVIVGPETMSSEWWNRRIQEAKDGLLKREGNRSHTQEQS